jgi:hypothetical protein
MHALDHLINFHDVPHLQAWLMLQESTLMAAAMHTIQACALSHARAAAGMAKGLWLAWLLATCICALDIDIDIVSLPGDPLPALRP